MEEILIKTRQYNLDHNILPSENLVINRLLARDVEMRPVYEELSHKLTTKQAENFWDAILGAATFWTPKESRKIRDAMKSLSAINSEISECASKLSSLIRDRRDISENSGIHSYDDYCVTQWIKQAAKGNHLFEWHLEEKLNQLAGQYDLKYWPETDEVIQAIVEYADNADIYPYDEWSEELVSSPKHSKSDYLRVILKAIEDRKTINSHPHPLPKEFKPTDNSLATLINCTLDLSADDLVSSVYIKRSRQNIREKSKAT